MNKVVEKLGNMNQTLEKHLERHNDIAQKMLDMMQKPENKFMRVLEISALLAGALSILGVVDIIKKWILGG